MLKTLIGLLPDFVGKNEIVIRFGFFKYIIAVLIPVEGKVNTEIDPISDKKIRSMFRRKENGDYILISGENSKIECKTSFALKNPQWLRSVAGLANFQGGYILFGVSENANEVSGEKEYVLKGLENSQFINTDASEFSRLVKNFFDPTPIFSTALVEIQSKTVGVIYVEESKEKPIIATRQDKHLIKEGDIFYRYFGETTRIKYSELRSILDARDSSVRSAIVPMISKLIKIGPQNALIADLESGVLGDGQSELTISEHLLEKMKLVKEGEFNAISGDPTLKLVGEVKVTKGATDQFKRGAITATDIFNDFLNQATPIDPMEYVRFAVQQNSLKWLPIRYFVKAADINVSKATEIIKSYRINTARSEFIISRLRKDCAFRKAVGASKGLVPKILNMEEIIVESSKMADHVAGAICAIPENRAVDFRYIIELTKNCYSMATSAEVTGNISILRRAICRVDEVYFSIK